jgi:hypothetical protein
VWEWTPTAHETAHARLNPAQPPPPTPVSPIFRRVFLEKVVWRARGTGSKREYATQRDGPLLVVRFDSA